LGRSDEHFQNSFSKHCYVSYPKSSTHHLKVIRKRILKRSSDIHKSSFGAHKAAFARVNPCNLVTKQKPGAYDPKHISHLARFRPVGRCAIVGFVLLGHKKSHDVYRTSRPIPFGWSMCDIRFCTSWPEKSQDAYRTSLFSSCSRASYQFVFKASYQFVLKGVVPDSAPHCGEQKSRTFRPRSKWV